MREEHGLTEPLLARGSDHLRRYDRQCGERRHIRTEGKRDEGRARLAETQADTTPEIIGTAGRTHCGGGGAACSNRPEEGGAGKESVSEGRDRWRGCEKKKKKRTLE